MVTLAKYNRVFWLAAAVVCFIAIDRQPLWMDEMGTWQYARAASPINWLVGFLKVRTSDGQLPLYHFLVYVWSKLFGFSPVALRCFNAPCLAVALLASTASPIQGPDRALWSIFLLINCFLWTYLNEARPYMMLIAGSAILMTSLLVASDTSVDLQNRMSRCVRWFIVGAVLSFGASPVSAPFIFSVLVAIVWSVKTLKVSHLASALRTNSLIILAGGCTAVILVLLVLYSINSGATPELRNKTNLLTILFGVAEVTGMGGFLPGRETLRLEGIGAISSWEWVGLSTYAMTMLGLIIRGLFGPRRALLLTLFAICACSVICVAFAGVFMGFRVLGRHIAFALPPLMLVCAIGADPNQHGHRLRIVLTSLFVSLLLVSSLIFRLDIQHRKDDTQAAASMLKQHVSLQSDVWWVGSYILPMYYGIYLEPLMGEHISTVLNKPVVIGSSNGSDWRKVGNSLKVPSTIVIERPEATDADHYFERYAKRAGLVELKHIRGFAIYSNAHVDPRAYR